jgi:post-segregation antitoxin (ccd killing protein)
MRLYTSEMRLLNVRLDDEDAQLVRRLRERGVSISDLVRAAIRSEAKALAASAHVDTDALLAEIRRKFPTPARLEGAPRVDATRRRDVQAVVREKLRRRT